VEVEAHRTTKMGRTGVRGCGSVRRAEVDAMDIAGCEVNAEDESDAAFNTGEAHQTEGDCLKHVLT
jgi:hypothetical protein